MSTNRTKIDWAYNQAQRIIEMGEDPRGDRYDLIRAIAAILRRAETRGQKKQVLTVATIRKCKKQLEAVAVPLEEVIRVNRMHTEDPCWCGCEHYCD